MIALVREGVRSLVEHMLNCDLPTLKLFCSDLIKRLQVLLELINLLTDRKDISGDATQINVGVNYWSLAHIDKVFLFTSFS